MNPFDSSAELAIRSDALRNETLAPTTTGSAFLRPEDLFDRFKILRSLGEGGYAAVYLAHDGQAARNVALKIATAKAEFHGVFSIEVNVLRSINAERRGSEPIVPELFDAGSYEDVPYYTMTPCNATESQVSAEWSAGKSREHYAYYAMAEIASLVHRFQVLYGLVHADIKPQNILLQAVPVGQLRTGFRIRRLLGDMGFAFPTTQPRGIGEDGRALCTPAYGAPEQMTHSVASGPAVDVYALGATAFELFTGTPPHMDIRKVRDLVDAKVHNGGLRNRELQLLADCKTPQQVIDVIRRMMAHDPSDRPAVVNIRNFFLNMHLKHNPWVVPPHKRSHVHNIRSYYLNVAPSERHVQVPSVGTQRDVAGALFERFSGDTPRVYGFPSQFSANGDLLTKTQKIIASPPAAEEVTIPAPAGEPAAQ